MRNLVRVAALSWMTILCLGCEDTAPSTTGPSSGVSAVKGSQTCEVLGDLEFPIGSGTRWRISPASEPGPDNMVGEWSNQHKEGKKCKKDKFVYVDGESQALVLIYEVKGSSVTNSQVATLDSYGFGRYTYRIRRSSAPSSYSVAALFSYGEQAAMPPPRNEIDIELTQWGRPGEDNLWYSLYPRDGAVAKELVDLGFRESYSVASRALDVSIHEYTWTPAGIRYRSTAANGDVLGSFRIPEGPWEVESGWATSKIPQDPMKAVINFWVYSETQPPTAPVTEGADTLWLLDFRYEAGALRGRVFDESTGDAVVGASVTLGIGQDVVAQAPTDEEGSYAFPSLPPDAYTITVGDLPPGCSAMPYEGTVLNGTTTVADITVSCVLYSDDFSRGLANWTMRGGGSWSIVDDRLVGEYDIGCGSVFCSQSQLLLVDEFQPAVADWRAEIQFTEVRYPYSAAYDLTYAVATFSLWVSDSEKDQIWVGYDVRNTPMPPSLDEVYVLHQRGMPWAHLRTAPADQVPSWIPSGLNTAALEKRGNQYKVFFNGLEMYSFTGAYSTTPKIGFNVYGKNVLDNFVLTALEP